MIGLLKAILPLILASVIALIGDGSQHATATGQMPTEHGSISGTVTELATGLPLNGIFVVAEGAPVRSEDFAVTDALGAYEIDGLAEGEYKVTFRELSGADTYLPFWYDNQPNRESADLVTVTPGIKTSGVDAQLAMGGSISGTVTEEKTGKPALGVRVVVVDLSFNFVVWSYTDKSGAFNAERIPRGDYKVMFFDCGKPGPYIDEWYDNRADFDSADVITVSEGSHVSGFDAQLAAGMFGDVNCNGTVNAIDATLLLQYGAGSGRLRCFALGDVNGDWFRNALDANLILQFVAGLLDSLPNN